MVVLHFLSYGDGEEWVMKRYVVELEAQERKALKALTRKGSHRRRR